MLTSILLLSIFAVPPLIFIFSRLKTDLQKESEHFPIWVFMSGLFVICLFYVTILLMTRLKEVENNNNCPVYEQVQVPLYQKK